MDKLFVCVKRHLLISRSNDPLATLGESIKTGHRESRGAFLIQQQKIEIARFLLRLGEILRITTLNLYSEPSNVHFMSCKEDKPYTP